jgi:uncharacterized protein (TIGR02678 family)
MSAPLPAPPERPVRRVAAQLDAEELEQFQRAVRLLLASPLVTETWPRPEALALVRRWEPVLRAELQRVLGYRLDVSRDCARLYRRPPTLSPHRGARRGNDRPMGPLACSFLCLALAALESLGDQTTASELSGEVLRLRSGDDALPVDFTQYDQRRALAAALRWLEARGVLALRDGELDQWLRDAEHGDALYDVHKDALSRLLVASPSVLRDVGTAQDFLVEPYAPSDDGHRTRLRHRVARRLVLDPVLDYAALPADELAYLRHRRTRIIGDVEQLTGCAVEARAEGLALLDAAVESLSGESFPSSGTEAQAALLWGTALVGLAVDAELPDDLEQVSAVAAGPTGAGDPEPSGAVDAGQPSRTVPAADPGPGGPPTKSPWRRVDPADADRAWQQVVDHYGSRFKIAYREAPQRLRPAVVALLERFGLLWVDDDDPTVLWCHGAMARFRPGPADGPGQAPSATLFDVLAEPSDVDDS